MAVKIIRNVILCPGRNHLWKSVLTVEATWWKRAISCCAAMSNAGIPWRLRPLFLQRRRRAPRPVHQGRTELFQSEIEEELKLAHQGRMDLSQCDIEEGA